MVGLCKQGNYIEIILKEKPTDVEKGDDEAPRVKITKRQAAMRRFVKVGSS